MSPQTNAQHNVLDLELKHIILCLSLISHLLTSKPRGLNASNPLSVQKLEYDS